MVTSRASDMVTTRAVDPTDRPTDLLIETLMPEFKKNF